MDARVGDGACQGGEPCVKAHVEPLLVGMRRYDREAAFIGGSSEGVRELTGWVALRSPVCAMVVLCVRLVAMACNATVMWHCLAGEAWWFKAPTAWGGIRVDVGVVVVGAGGVGEAHVDGVQGCCVVVVAAHVEVVNVAMRYCGGGDTGIVVRGGGIVRVAREEDGLPGRGAVMPLTVGKDFEVKTCGVVVW